MQKRLGSVGRGHGKGLGLEEGLAVLTFELLRVHRTGERKVWTGAWDDDDGTESEP